MNKSTQQALFTYTAQFYRALASEFSHTRQAHWYGWNELKPFLTHMKHSPLHVCDVACGNARFSQFLAHITRDNPEFSYTYTGIDRETFPLSEEVRTAEHKALSYHTARIDFAELLCNDAQSLSSQLKNLYALITHANDLNATELPEAFDLVACFGFLHHVPGYDLRVAFLTELAQLLAPQGLLCISLWAFMDDARLARKAESTTQLFQEKEPELAGSFEKHDYMLGWRNAPYVRFCHHFDQQERMHLIDELITKSSVPLILESMWSSELRENVPLNHYLLFRRI